MKVFYVSGLRRLQRAYIKITFADIAKKLGLPIRTGCPRFGSKALK